MLYKNSIKILLSNFNIVWRILLYFFVVFVVLCVSLYFLVNPVLKIIENAGFFEQFVGFYKDFLSSLDLTTLFENLRLFFDDLILFVVENISNLWYFFVGIFFVLSFLKSFLLGLVNIPCCLSLHLYVGSMTKQGFFASFFETLGKSIRFELVHFLVSAPINVLFVFLFLQLLKLFGVSWLLSVFAIVLIIVLFVLLFSFKTVFFSVWAPAIIVLNYGVFKSLVMSVKVAAKRFLRYFSAAVGVVITLIVLNVVVCFATFIFGLFLSIPISYLLCNVFGTVVLYEAQGMRYYVDVYNVITIMKKELNDKIKDLKYII